MVKDLSLERNDCHLMADDTQLSLEGSPLNKNNARQPDTWWSWVVCLSAVLCNIIVIGCASCFGIIFPSLLDEFHEGKAKTAWVGSMAMAGAFFFGPVAGKLSDLPKFGARVVIISGAMLCVLGLILTSLVSSLNLMYLTYGGIFGFGSSLVYISIYAVVPRYFIKRRSLATGLLATSVGGGVALMSPVCQALIDAFGWRGSFRGLGCITLVVVFLGWIFNPNVPLSEGGAVTREQTKTRILDFTVWRIPEFTWVTVIYAMMYLGHSIPPPHLARYSEGLGFTADHTTWLYSSMGLASLLARLPGSRLCDVIGSLTVMLAAGFVSAVANLLLPLEKTWGWLLSYSIVYGLCNGFQAIGGILTILNILPTRQKAQGYGFYEFVVGVSLLSGPPIGGLIAEKTSSYHPAFLAAGGIQLLGLTVGLIYVCIKNNNYLGRKGKEIEHEARSAELLVVEKLTVL